MTRWVGIDCGYSRLRVAIIDESTCVLASETTSEPRGDGHDRDVALRRLRELLPRIAAFGEEPVCLAGYCYIHSGVREVFSEADWNVLDVRALNDVVGVYGLTEMIGDAVVASCGTASQVVYIDADSNVCWPSDDIDRDLPTWLLNGRAYAEHLRARLPLADVQGDAEDLLLTSGDLVSQAIDRSFTRTFLARAAEAVRATRDAFWAMTGTTEAPTVVVAGGAVSDDNLWAVVDSALVRLDVRCTRVSGGNAVGLARYALLRPDADPWSFIGAECPTWLR